MPEQRVENVLHYRGGKIWMQPTVTERPTYDEQVAARIDELRGTAYGSAFFEHDPGECVECDAIRALDDED